MVSLLRMYVWYPGKIKDDKLTFCHKTEPSGTCKICTNPTHVLLSQDETFSKAFSTNHTRSSFSVLWFAKQISHMESILEMKHFHMFCRTTLTNPVLSQNETFPRTYLSWLTCSSSVWKTTWNIPVTHFREAYDLQNLFFQINCSLNFSCLSNLQWSLWRFLGLSECQNCIKWDIFE